jgi:hypothetical protein
MSNIIEVMTGLKRWLAEYNFQRPGHQQSMGRDIAGAVVDGISDRSDRDGKGKDDVWPPNSDKPSHWTPPNYRKWKLDNYGIDLPNYRTGQMLSNLSLMGRTRIEPYEIVMIYGTNTVPVRAYHGSPRPELLARDQKVTDTQKAYFAHTGQSKKKIRRPFYELDDKIAQDVYQVCVANLTDYIIATNGLMGTG